MTRANTEQLRHTPWFAKAGAACSIVPIARFVSEHIFALKGGGYGCLFSLSGLDEEALTDRELESRVLSIEGALRGLPEGSSLYQYARVMSGFELPRRERYENPVTEVFATERLQHLEKNAGFRRIDLHWCLTLEPPKLKPCTPTTLNTFAVDPNFRVGYAQTWQLSAQRDLPFALQMTATYLGIKGTRGVQEFLPNTYPIGGTNPCPSCLSYITTDGDSTRESGSFQLRRRLRSGFSASALYTYSKSIDDDSQLGGQGRVRVQTHAVINGARIRDAFDIEPAVSARQHGEVHQIRGGIFLAGRCDSFFGLFLLYQSPRGCSFDTSQRDRSTTST